MDTTVPSLKFNHFLTSIYFEKKYDISLKLPCYFPHIQVKTFWNNGVSLNGVEIQWIQGI